MAISSALGCSVSRIQKKGHTASDSFYYKGHFSTVKSLIVLPVEVNGATKNFLFDTGAEVTLIQRDTVTGKTTTVDGATNRSMKLGGETIRSIKIGDVEFVDTYAMGGDFKGLREQVLCFGGLVGQPIISKANWLIDYPSRRIEVSSRSLIDSSYTALKVRVEHGLPYITLVIDGCEYKALIDLGSSSAFTIPEGSTLANQVLSRYSFKENQRDVYTIGGLQSTKEKAGSIAAIYLDGIAFKDVPTTIRHTSQLRVGNDFFKNYILYIDNLNARYCLKRAY